MNLKNGVWKMATILSWVQGVKIYDLQGYKTSWEEHEIYPQLHDTN